MTVFKHTLSWEPVLGHSCTLALLILNLPCDVWTVITVKSKQTNWDSQGLCSFPKVTSDSQSRDSSPGLCDPTALAPNLYAPIWALTCLHLQLLHYQGNKLMRPETLKERSPSEPGCPHHTLPLGHSSQFPRGNKDGKELLRLFFLEPLPKPAGNPTDMVKNESIWDTEYESLARCWGQMETQSRAFHPEPLSKAPLGWFLEDSLGTDANAENRREERKASHLGLRKWKQPVAHSPPSGLQHFSLAFGARSCLHPNNLFSAPSSPRPSSESASKNTSRDREHSRDGSRSTRHTENTIFPSQQEENPPSLAGQFPPSLGADCDHTSESWLQGCKWKLVELDLISLTLPEMKWRGHALLLDTCPSHG